MEKTGTSSCLVGFYDRVSLVGYLMPNLVYVYISGDSSLFLLLVPPRPSVNFSSQPVVRGPKVSNHSCYCVILHCIAQIDKRTLHGVFFVNNQDTI